MLVELCALVEVDASLSYVSNNSLRLLRCLSSRMNIVRRSPPLSSLFFSAFIISLILLAMQSWQLEKMSGLMKTQFLRNIDAERRRKEREKPNLKEKVDWRLLSMSFLKRNMAAARIAAALLLLNVSPLSESPHPNNGDVQRYWDGTIPWKR